MSDCIITLTGPGQREDFKVTLVPYGSPLMRRLKRRRHNKSQFFCGDLRVRPDKTIGDLMRAVNKIDGWEMRLV